MTDERVKWSGTTVVHDSYDLDRLHKIRDVLVPFIRAHGAIVPLRVCIGRRSVISATTQLNCGQCAKCMVIELTLFLSGIDPAECGFDVSPAALEGLRRNLEAGEFGRGYDEATWEFIKGHAASVPREMVGSNPGLEEFCRWFSGWDEKPKASRRLVDRVAPSGTRRRDLAKAMFGPGGVKRAGSEGGS